MPYALSCLMRYVLSYLLRALVPHLSRARCEVVLKIPRVPRPLVPHVSYVLLHSCALRFLVLLVPRTACAIIPHLLQVF